MLYNLGVKGICMKTITAAYAKANLGAVLDRVAKGERVTISRYNRPIAELGPPANEARPIPKLGTGKGKVKVSRCALGGSALGRRCG